MTWEKELEKIYTSPGESSAFSSVDKLFRKLKKEGYNVTRLQIKSWLDNNYTYAIHKYRRKTFPRNPILASDIDQNWQADILFLKELSNYNDNKSCVLLCIDVISRYAWGEPMKSKSGKDTASAFEKILKKANRKPEKLQTDKGKEFYNSDFKSVLKKYNIKLYSTESDKKASIAERCIKEIKKLIYRYLTFKQTNRYIDVLNDLFQTYNSTYHSGIKMAPMEVKEENLGNVLNALYGKLWEKDQIPLKKRDKKIKEIYQFKIDDAVRIVLPNDLFSKGYKGFWTTEIFYIDQIKPYYPFTQYKLRNERGEILKGLFYKEQLQKASQLSQRYTNVIILKKKKINGKDWVLIKWKNESPEIKRWVPFSQLR